MLKCNNTGGNFHNTPSVMLSWIKSTVLQLWNAGTKDDATFYARATLTLDKTYRFVDLDRLLSLFLLRLFLFEQFEELISFFLVFQSFWVQLSIVLDTY